MSEYLPSTWRAFRSDVLSIVPTCDNAIMIVNGIHVCYHASLMTNILRDGIGTDFSSARAWSCVDDNCDDSCGSICGYVEEDFALCKAWALMAEHRWSLRHTKHFKAWSGLCFCWKTDQDSLFMSWSPLGILTLKSVLETLSLCATLHFSQTWSWSGDHGWMRPYVLLWWSDGLREHRHTQLSDWMVILNPEFQMKTYNTCDFGLRTVVCLQCAPKADLCEFHHPGLFSMTYHTQLLHPQVGMLIVGGISTASCWKAWACRLATKKLSCSLTRPPVANNGLHRPCSVPWMVSSGQQGRVSKNLRECNFSRASPFPALYLASINSSSPHLIGGASTKQNNIVA